MPHWFLRAMLLQELCQSEWSVLPPGARVISEPRRLPRTMSGSVALLQPGSVLKFVAHGNRKGHMDTQGLGCNLGHVGV